MLHIELYSEYNGSLWWRLGEEKPNGIEDPNKLFEK